MFQLASSYGRLGVPGKILKFLLGAANIIWNHFKKATGREDTGIHAPSSSGGGYGLDEHWIHKRASYFSKLVIGHQNVDRITHERRTNYLRLYEALGELPGSRPLFDHLPEGMVPLVFPLYVEQPDLYFDKLKRAGVPIWRFGEFLDETVTDDLCSNSVTLSAKIFQIPCHQELTDKDMDWIINKITALFHTQSLRS